MMIEATIVLMFVIFFLNNNLNLKFEPANYLMRSLQHANLYHLIANSYALWQLRDLAAQLGPNQFMMMIVMIWIISSGLLYLIHRFVPNTKRTTVGFSGVILGLILINNFNLTGQLNLISLNLLTQILPHFFVPGISFWGHLSGILAGLVYILGSSFLSK